MRHALLAFLLVVAASALAVAQTSPAPSSPAELSAQPTPPAPAPGDGGDGWGFEEDEHVETWQEILEPQLLDVALVAGFFTFSLVSFFKKSKPLKYAALVMAVAYLGFSRSFLVSVTNIFAIIGWKWPILKYNLAWYLFFGFSIVSTVVWGRLYCGRLCAYGALTQLLDAVIPAKYRFEVPRALELRAAWIKYGLLAFVVVYFLATRDIMIYRYVEPFWMFGMAGSALMWTLLGVLLLATVFVRNLYCRFLCPVGASLGIISQVTTAFPIKRWSECKTCRICEKACEWGAIQGPKIVKSECVRCDDCERIYDDKQKCVHWLIIRKKEARTAVS